MQHAKPLEVSITGRPVIDPTETELILSQNIALYDGDNSTPTHENGVIRLTSHRILYSNPAGCNIFFSLELLSPTLEKIAGFLMRHPKIKITFTTSPPTSVKISFRDGGCDQFYDLLQSALRRAAWKDVPSGKSTLSSVSASGKRTSFDPLKAGIAAVERSIEERQKETQDSLGTAFKDMQELMARARDMVQLAERMAAHMKRSDSGATASTNEEFSSIAMKIGFSAPVTKESAGSLYYTELARQVTDLLLGHVRQYGGMILMPDAYCLVNRARGTALISPQDLVQACSMLESLRLPLTMRKFPSGVLVLQDENYSDTAFAKRIVDYLNGLTQAAGAYSGVADTDVSHQFSVSLAIAHEQLLNAEASGYLVRDETVEGTKFFVNILPSFCV